MYLEDSLGYDLTVEQLLDNISVYYDDSTEYDEDYEEMEAFRRSIGRIPYICKTVC